MVCNLGNLFCSSQLDIVVIWIIVAFLPTRMAVLCGTVQVTEIVKLCGTNNHAIFTFSPHSHVWSEQYLNLYLHNCFELHCYHIIEWLNVNITIVCACVFMFVTLLFQPFRCAHCHYSCNISGSLKRHYNKKHPGEKYNNAGPGRPTSETGIEQGLFLQIFLFITGLLSEENII